MDAGFGLWLFVVSVGASALGGMVGMASGIFIVPILALFGGVDLRTAIGASIVSVIACSCASAASFLERGLTNVRLAIVLETATTLGALTGVFCIGIVPASFLYGLFAVVLLVSAYQMLAPRAAIRSAPTLPTCLAIGRTDFDSTRAIPITCSGTASPTGYDSCPEEWS
jgi:uncharacterized membrane protein YfcA